MSEVSQSSNIPFTDTAGQLAADHDVLMCYQLLLGRNPENSYVIQEAKTQPIRSILSAFIRSGEFAEHVIGPFQRGEKVRHEADSSGPSTEQLSWLQTELSLSEHVASDMASARSWQALFAILFTLPGFLPDAPQPETQAASPPEIQAASPPETQPASAPEPEPRALLGAVDGWSGSSVRGWCIDMADPARPVTLVMLADGVELGRCACKLPHRHVKSVLGSNGLCGFDFPLPEWIRARRFILTAHDVEDNTEVLGPLNIPAAQDALAGHVAALQTRVRDLETLARQVVGSLPGLETGLRHLADGLPPARAEPQGFGPERLRAAQPASPEPDLAIDAGR